MAATSRRSTTPAQEAIAHLRAGKGPVFFWVKMERLSSHTSSDDHKLYRSAEEIENLAKGDPLTKWQRRLDRRRRSHRGRIREARPGNQGAHSPGIHRRRKSDRSVARTNSSSQVTGPLPELDDEVLPAGQISHRRRRQSDPARRPNEGFRGGSFSAKTSRIRKAASFASPKNFPPNSPSRFSIRRSPNRRSSASPAASRPTASGRSSSCSSSTSSDPGWNQLVTNLCNLALAFLRHLDVPAGDLRSLRRLPARRQPLAQPGKRSPLAHYPGINIAIPSTPEDAAGLLWTRDALRRSDVCSYPETSALGGTRIRRADPRGVVRQSAHPSARRRCHGRRLGQHDGEIDRSARENRRQRQRRVDRPAFDRAVGSRRRSKNRCARPAGSSSCRRTRRIAASAR